MRKTQFVVFALAGIFTSGSLAEVIHYSFEDTLDGWINNIPPQATLSENFQSTAVTAGDRVRHHDGSSSISEVNFADRDGADDNIKVFSSPSFGLTTTSSIELWLNGGMGGTATPTWSNYADIPAVAATGEFLGVALRRISDDEYVLFNRKTSNGQYSSWQNRGWSTAQLSGVLTTDGAAETYAIDLIDAFSDGWGWTAIDDVTLTNVTIPEQATMSMLALGGLVIFLRRKA